MTIFPRVLFCCLMVILNIVSIGCGGASDNTTEDAAADSTSSSASASATSATPHFFDKEGYNNGEECFDANNGEFEAVFLGRCSRITSDNPADWTPHLNMVWLADGYGAVGCNEGYDKANAQKHCSDGDLCTVQYVVRLDSPITGYELLGRVYGMWQIDAITEEGSCLLYSSCLAYCAGLELYNQPCPSLDDNPLGHLLCTSCRDHTGKMIRATKKRLTCPH